MANYIKKIRTDVGDLQIDYEALANLPKADETLSQSGKFADAKVVGDKIKDVTDRKAETATYAGTLKAGSWSASAPYSQNVTINGILITDSPFVDVDMSGASSTSAGTALLEAWGLVGRVVANAGSITAYCYEEKPTVNIPIILKVVR